MLLNLMPATNELNHWLQANWPAPDNVLAGTTTRPAGYSQALFDSMNLAMHVTDDAATVQQNRNFLRESLDLPADPLWLKQIHGNEVIKSHSKESRVFFSSRREARTGRIASLIWMRYGNID